MKPHACVFALLAAETVLSPVAAADPEPLPVLRVRELAFSTRGPGGASGKRRVHIGLPAGWTGEREPDGRSMRLFGPEGEGRILVAAALDPSGLTPYLDELKRRHPAAAPSPPAPMELPGVRPALGERATRFVITGREVGEMVLIEKRETIVLVVTVVDPSAWPALSRVMDRAYRTVEILDAR